MIDIETFRELALSFEEATEEPHFEKSSFRVRKKIFATLNVQKLQLVLKFSEIEQSIFCEIDSSIIYPVAGAWGKKGWSIVELSSIKKDILIDALTTSYCQVAPKKLADQYRPASNS